MKLLSLFLVTVIADLVAFCIFIFLISVLTHTGFVTLTGTTKRVTPTVSPVVEKKVSPTASPSATVTPAKKLLVPSRAVSPSISPTAAK